MEIIKIIINLVPPMKFFYATRSAFKIKKQFLSYMQKKSPQNGKKNFLLSCLLYQK